MPANSGSDLSASRNQVLIAVMGCTATGKTSLAEALAHELDAQLMNADAFQVYRGMDIGTAKPSDKDRYSLLDLKNPDEAFGVGEWVQLALSELRRIWIQGRSAVIVGGTGLYIRALYEQYRDLQPAPDPALRADIERRESAIGLTALYSELLERSPEAATGVDPNNPVRVRRALERALSPGEPINVEIPPFRKLKLAIHRSAQEISENIALRTQGMLQNGWSLEVEELRDRGYRPEDPGFRALGYREMWDYLEHKMELQEAIATTIAATQQYAKRQRTWLRSEPGLVMLAGESAPEIFEQAMGAVRANFT